MEPKQTETLPIYRKTLEVCHQILKITDNFPKRLQDNLGKRMVDCSLTMLRKILETNKCNVTEGRFKFLSEFLLEFDYLMILVRIMDDLKLVGVDRLAILFENLDSIERQANGWRNSYSS